MSAASKPPSASSQTHVTLKSLLAALDQASKEEGLELLTRFTDEEDTISDDLHASADKNLRKTIFEPEKGRRPAITIPIRGISPGCRRLMDFITEQPDVARYLSKPDVAELWRILEDGDAPESAAALCALCNHILAQRDQASFKELRRLRLCGRSSKKVAPVKIRPDEWKATVTAWKQSYAGEHHEHLYKQMQQMKAATNSPYSNVLPIIQSSGTGKSRLAYEVSGKIVTLPLNVHRPADGGADFVYPEPDTEVAKYLAGIEDKIHHNDTMKQWHLAFLCCWMQAAATELMRLTPNETYAGYEHLARAWRAYLSEEEEVAQPEKTKRVTRRTRMYHDAVKRSRQLFEQCQGNYEAGGLEEHCQTQGLKPLLDNIRSRVRQEVTDPPILLLFTIDEVDGLSDVPVNRPGVSPETITAYDVFLSALQDLGSSMPFFVLTLSTHSRLDKHAPSRLHHSSTRGTSNEAVHQAPWTELPFDVLLDGKPVFVPGTVTLDDVAQPAFMVKLGRVLWYTRWEGAMDGSAVRAEILKFAFVKLTRQTPEALAALLNDKKTPEQLEAMKLSAIAMRVGLDFDLARQPTRDLLQTMIARHMHIAYTVPSHREYVLSGAPSEPILAHAAASVMNDFPGLVDAPATVSNALQRGIVDKGARGELVGRLLMIRAHDHAHNLKRGHLAPDVPNMNCSAKVPVIDLLQALFAEDHHAAILGATPENAVLSSNVPSLQKAFEGAFVRYTHFVRLAKSDIYDSHVGAAGLARGMAFQGYSQQPSYDLVIPILMKDEALQDSLVSFILIQIKDRLKTQAVTVKTDTAMFSSRTKLPYIVIVMELGLNNPNQYGVAASCSKERTSSRPKQQDQNVTAPDHPVYKITATGCTPEVYGVISDKDSIHYTSLLATQDIFSEHPRQDKESVDMIRRMKPVWDCNSPCFDWVASEDLRTPRK